MSIVDITMLSVTALAILAMAGSLYFNTLADRVGENHQVVEDRDFFQGGCKMV